MKITIEVDSIDELIKLKERITILPAPQEPIMEFQNLEAPIDNLNLPAHTKNCLLAIEINTIGDLLSWSESRLLNSPNIGKKMLGQITGNLAALGLGLRANEPN
jgi:DNA-directed RNA polymerase alpha subunit